MSKIRALRRVRPALERLKKKWTPRTTAERNAFNLYISTASVGFVQAGYGAYLAIFVARLGAPAHLIGLLSSVPAIVSMVALLPAGFLVERTANQVRLRNLSIFIARTHILLLALAPFVLDLSAIPVVAIVIATIQTAGMSVATPAFMTVLSDAIPPENRSQVQGVRWALLNVVSASLAPILGRMLDLIAFPLNYQVLFLLSYVGGLGTIRPFAKLKVPPLEVSPRPLRQSEGLRQGLEAYWSSIKESKAFVRFVMGTVGLRLAIAMPTALFTLFWVNELGASDGLIGLRQTVAYIGLVLGYLAWGRWAKYLSLRLVLTISVVFLALYILITAAVPSAFWIVPIAFLWGFSTAGINIGMFDTLLASVEKEKMPRLSSVHNMIANAAVFIGPLLGVALSQITSLRIALVIVGGAVLLSTATFRLLPADG